MDKPRRNYVISYTNGRHYILEDLTEVEAIAARHTDGDHVICVTPASEDDVHRYPSLKSVLPRTRNESVST